jgi:hypothetical protein
MKTRKYLAGFIAALSTGLMLLMLTPLTGCVGYVAPDEGYYPYAGPDVVVFGGGWGGRGHFDRAASFRGGVSRGGHGGGGWHRH